MPMFSFHPAFLPAHLRRSLKQFMDTPVLGKPARKRGSKAKALTAVQSDVMSALRNQGYRASDARRAVAGKRGSFDSVFRAAIQSLRRK